MIDIYQEPGCQVTSARFSVAYGASVAKIVIRYRMAAVAWIVAWIAAGLSRSMSILQSTGEYLIRMLPLYVLQILDSQLTKASGAYLPFADILQSSGRRDFFILAGTLYTTSLGLIGFLLDAQGLPGVLAIGSLSTWTFGFVNLLCMTLDAVLWVPTLFLANKRTGT